MVAAGIRFSVNETKLSSSEVKFRIVLEWWNFNKLFSMKILFIIVCLMSTKSVFGVNYCMQYQQLNNFRRRLFFPSQCRRINFEMIASKQFFECNCQKSTYNQNRDYPKQQKPPYAVSGLRNNAGHAIIRNPITGKTKYFKDPKIIMVSSLTQAKRVFGNDQNQKEENREKTPPPYLRPISKNEKQTFNSSAEESLRKNQKEDFHPDFVVAKEYAAENPKLENKTSVTEIPKISLYQSPSNPSNETYSQPISNLISLLRINPTQTYEVEEIFEEVINEDEEEFKKIPVNEKTFSDPEIKDISNDHHEQEVLDDSIGTIVQEITGTENNLSSNEKISTKVSGDEKKANVYKTTATTQVQPSTEISFPEKTVIFNETTPYFGEYYSREKNHSDRLQVNNEQGPLRPLNKLHEIFKLPPPNTTYNIFENSKKHDFKKFESLPHTFIGFFNKKVTEKPTQKSGGVPKNLNLNSLSLSLIPTSFFGNLSSGSLENLNENPQPELISTSATSETFIPSLQDQKTSNFFTRALDTKPPLPLNHNKAESESITSKIPRSHTASPIFNSTVRNLDLTISHSQEYPDGVLSIDLLSTTISSELKKDQESNGKNSRKMHFNQNTQKETESSENTEKSNQHPRRSDILITDYMDDYKDNENRVSTLTFLGRIKPNDAILSGNFSSSSRIDYYISLIPDMLNDIRENKISPQDLSILSSIFGKYWPRILTLSNDTELDVLPLLTMKKEKDLISILEAHFSNESEFPTTEMVKMEVDGKESSETYDNTNEHLYDYVFHQEPRRIRKPNRNKRDYKYQNLEYYEYFETVEDEESNGSKVDFTVNDESGEDGNPSALELTNTADFNLNIRHLTSRKAKLK